MLSKKPFQFILLVGDVFLMYLALLLTLAIRYKDFSFLPGPQTRIFLFHFSFIYLVWISLLFLLDFYEIPPFKKIFNFFYNLTVFVFLAGALGSVYFYLQPQLGIAPKTILIIDVIIFAIFLCGWRYLFSRVLKLKSFREKIVIIGYRSEFKELLPDHLDQNGYEVIAFFHSQSYFNKELNSFLNSTRYRIISDIAKFKEIIRKENVNSIIFAFDFHKNEKLVQQIFSNLPLKLDYISFSNFYESLTKKVPIEVVDELWFLENFSRIERKIDEILKRTFDIIFSLFGLLILIILFPFIALAIKIDSSGPIFYIQKRVGKDGKVFSLNKFRTMKKNAEKNGPQWATPNDSRITSVGKVLRKIYFDELPQFYNILKGDISFVGPRPERPEFVEQFKKEIPYYEIRHLVKSGFTGWAQVNYRYGASVEEAKEKFQYDLYYIKNRSFVLDLGIILKTIRIIFR
jgi:exopolysaccharide biosynthesis polyprenyl glycosylphosphotransferase